MQIDTLMPHKRSPMTRESHLRRNVRAYDKGIDKKVSRRKVSIASPRYRIRKLTFMWYPSRNRLSRRLSSPFRKKRSRSHAADEGKRRSPHANEKTGPLSQWVMEDNSIIDYHDAEAARPWRTKKKSCFHISSTQIQSTE